MQIGGNTGLDNVESIVTENSMIHNQKSDIITCMSIFIGLFWLMSGFALLVAHAFVHNTSLESENNVKTVYWYQNSDDSIKILICRC